jgi:hypothetical protein
MIATSTPPLTACPWCSAARAVAAQRRPQRAADALEARLDHVMRVLAAHRQVQRGAEAVGERAEEMRHQFARQLADLFAAEAALEHEIRRGPTGRARPALRSHPSPAGSRSGRCRPCHPGLAQRLPYRQRAVLDRVVLVDVQIAAAAQPQRKAAVLGELLEHVIEEADAGGDVAGAPLSSSTATLDVGFARLRDTVRAVRAACA